MKALIFDTETTGLLPPSIARDNYQPRIIEFFGHIIDDDGSSIRELEFFCNPGIEISEDPHDAI
jgi:DNA polymerase III alpha subunit (gram-positive type)